MSAPTEDFNMTVAIMNIRDDMATMKTDIAWMKRIAGAVVVITGVFFGVDLTGVI